MKKQMLDDRRFPKMHLNLQRLLQVVYQTHLVSLMVKIRRKGIRISSSSTFHVSQAIKLYWSNDSQIQVLDKQHALKRKKARNQAAMEVTLINGVQPSLGSSAFSHGAKFMKVAHISCVFTHKDCEAK